MNHSSIVGGSSASRVIQCPGSVNLCAKAPPKPSSSYADEGTLLHGVMDEIMGSGKKPEALLGVRYEEATLTQALLDEKIYPTLALIDELDPDREMEYMTETRVHFGDFLPGVFGSTDLMGRLGKRAIVADYKMGSGIIVDAEENYQLMFYAAAAMRTEEAKWIFDGAKEIELVIIQPPEMRRWVTTFERIAQFELELDIALKLAESDNPPLKAGSHCKWCAAKPTCPKMTGAMERALKTDLKAISPELIAAYLGNAVLLEGWIKDLRDLANQMLENSVPVPGYKLVAKRGTRKWRDEAEAKKRLIELVAEDEVTETSLLSPAQAEKVLKKHKIALPEDLIVSISSGNTMAEESDPRPAIMQLGMQMRAALEKLN